MDDKVYKLDEQYYEAVIQLRPPTPEIVGYIEKQVQKKRDVFITKIIDLKTGIDIYITSQKFARNLGQKLKKVFGGRLTITKTIHTRDRMRSRNLYRATVLFRPFLSEDEEQSGERKGDDEESATKNKGNKEAAGHQQEIE